MRYLSLVGLSFAIHYLLFTGVYEISMSQEHALATEGKAAAQAKKDPLQLEFVEAPVKTSLKEPSKKTQKISDRDAINQDTAEDKSHPEAGPHTAVQEAADQLAQLKADQTSPPVPPQEARPLLEPIQASPEDSDKTRAAVLSEMESPDTQMIDHLMKEAAQSQPESKPQPEVVSQPMPVTGHDNITTQEMSRNPSAGAGVFGTTSFEATGSGMGAYMKNIKEKVWAAWFPYLAFKYPQDFRGSDAVISFVLNAQGDLRIVRVLTHEGSDVFASYCMEAVQRVGNFGAVPPEILALIGKDEIEIRFGFRYS